MTEGAVIKAQSHLSGIETIRYGLRKYGLRSAQSHLSGIETEEPLRAPPLEALAQSHLSGIETSPSGHTCAWWSRGLNRTSAVLKPWYDAVEDALQQGSIAPQRY